jgi:hypothetical protein
MTYRGVRRQRDRRMPAITVVNTLTLRDIDIPTGK